MFLESEKPLFYMQRKETHESFSFSPEGSEMGQASSRLLASSLLPRLLFDAIIAGDHAPHCGFVDIWAISSPNFRPR